MTVLAMKETYLHAWIILKKMTIPAWLDREEYPYEPHFFTTPAGTMQRWYGSKMPAILFRRRSTDELIGGIKDLIRG